ncbi:ABC transporter ATP-binding protein [Deinococcus hopiensis]|uniref:ABC-type Fe3+/spermidine/putrescine transport systems, ATPase components n=1 Tax=Deinococcus hopiensis KR-140 TaxID=695939 RepID=A0A1W1V9S9_9DEIO|nr:ABC transporter ATP-binding protein [Deinococcus hopiensis]SMB90033.1 ABC-type Fe3+/spermidine/putrescine transport systems, ATPase components [Deinococcus hopiensis KR-140]
MNALQLTGLSKRFGAVTAVQDLSLKVAAGETVALLGPSGCGKSTVLRCVAGLERPNAGRVEVGQRDVTELPPEARHVGLVFQDYALFPHLNVLSNVAYGPRMRGKTRAHAEAQARQTLALVGLETLEGRRPAQLSGGQAQRVALARAVATGSPLLLLDEPLSNLDEQLRARLRADLRALFARVGAGVLIVTHDQREALALAHRVAVMRAGRLIQVGGAQEVFAQPATAWVAAFLGHTNLLPASSGEVLLVPENAVRLGEGEALPVVTRQTTGAGLEVTVRHPLGPLTLHLSPREAAQLEGDTLRLSLTPPRLLPLPDDR